ncbi:MAG: GntR family transcriptional regulator [Alphaproteobacteria bacterium]|nr:GntR family transcriptional regulator [Alphaproteobacteria bacterium]
MTPRAAAAAAGIRLDCRPGPLPGGTTLSIPDLDRIDARTLRGQAGEALRAALRSGQFEPGQKVTIRGLSTALRISPTPIREALHGLAAEGAIEILPNRLIRVPLLSTERLEELRSLRVMLEGHATALATRNFDKRDVAALEAAEARIVALRRDGDVKLRIRAIGAFHFMIYDGARQPILGALIESLWLRTAPYVNYLFPAYADREAGRLRGKILAAIARKDEEAARAALERDIGAALDYIIELSRAPAYRARLASAI